jgi:hypothetical protein
VRMNSTTLCTSLHKNSISLVTLIHHNSYVAIMLSSAHCKPTLIMMQL